MFQKPWNRNDILYFSKFEKLKKKKDANPAEILFENLETNQLRTEYKLSLFCWKPTTKANDYKISNISVIRIRNTSQNERNQFLNNDSLHICYKLHRNVGS